MKDQQFSHLLSFAESFGMFWQRKLGSRALLSISEVLNLFRHLRVQNASNLYSPNQEIPMYEILPSGCGQKNSWCFCLEKDSENERLFSSLDNPSNNSSPLSKKRKNLYFRCYTLQSPDCYFLTAVRIFLEVFFR